MKYNKNFARSENKTELVFAPGEFDFGGVHYNAANDEKIYNEMGYLRYIRSEMPVKPGFYFTPYYEEDGKCLYQRWQEHELENNTADEESVEYALAAKILFGEEDVE